MWYSNLFQNASMPNERISYNFGTIFIFYPTLTQKLLNRFSPFLTRSRAISGGAINACISRRYCISFQNTRAKSEEVNFDAGKNRPKLIGYHSNVPWSRLLRNLCQFYNPYIYIYQRWNVGKDWFSSCWDIRRYRPMSVKSQHNFHFLPHFNSKTTEPIFTIFYLIYN